MPVSDGLVRSLALSPNSNLLATASRDGVLTLWDVATGEKLHKKEEGVLGFQVVAFSPDGCTLATGGIGRTVQLFSVADLTKTKD